MSSGNRYTALIWFLDVFLLLVSTALVYLGTSLIVFYNLDRLNIESNWYSTVPYFMICTGVANFLVALYGFAVAASQKRVHLITYAAILIILFVAQIVAIFASLELRADIKNDAMENTDVFNALVDYETDSSVKERWDTLHRQYHCCGGINYNDGYMIWSNVPMSHPNSVPDSCCLLVFEGCGRNILLNHEVAPQKIFVHGCLTVVGEKLDKEVVPICLGYTGIGTIIALIQIIIAVLAFTRNAAIQRKKKYIQQDRGGGNPSGKPLANYKSVDPNDATVL